MDAQYTAEEYSQHVGWGHGCVDDVVRLASQAKVGRLFLFHHDPDHDDAMLDRMEKHAQSLAARLGGGVSVAAAREGQEVVVRSRT